MGRVSSYLLAMLLLVSCVGSEGDDVVRTRTFDGPSVPSVMSGSGDEVKYVQEHYWDCLADTSSVWLTDSTHVSGFGETDMEQAFSNFVGLLYRTPLVNSQESVSIMYDRMSVLETRDSTAFSYMVNLVRKYLYDTASPFRCEDLYLPFARRAAEDKSLSEAYRNVFVYETRMCSLNQTGSPASDFSFTDKNGGLHTLHSIKADYVFLIFSNPGCNGCKTIVERIVKDEKISGMTESGKLAILNIYIDEDISAWKDSLVKYPDNWLNGYDYGRVISSDTLYNVRAIPSIYILDRDKKVIMKDVPEDRAFAFLDNINQ